MKSPLEKVKVFKSLFIILTTFKLGFAAGAIFPVEMREKSSFDAQVLQAVNDLWDHTMAKESKERSILNPEECKIFEDYVQTILVKLIKSSHLERATQDLYFNMDCYNFSKHPTLARLFSRTLEINQGYLGSLKSEDALASVLAHELSHHILRHEDIIEPRRPTPNPHKNADLFSRGEPTDEEYQFFQLIQKHEVEADLNSVAIMANAGYSYEGAFEVLNFIKDNVFGAKNGSATHDSPDQRIKLIAERAQSLSLRPGVLKKFPEEVNKAITVYFSKDGPSEKRMARKKIFPAEISP